MEHPTSAHAYRSVMDFAVRRAVRASAGDEPFRFGGLKQRAVLALAVLGHSWSGVLAMEYAIRHPERMTHLILMNEPITVRQTWLRGGTCSPVVVAV